MTGDTRRAASAIVELDELLLDAKLSVPQQPCWLNGPLAEDRVAWVTLDRFDDDPAVLLTLLASAYAPVSSGNADLVARR